MQQILELVSNFQNEAQRVRRFDANPFVCGDNIAEHIARGVRLIAYIAPKLINEFPEEKNLIEDLLFTFIIHDDDEILSGRDITTFIKSHNVNDNSEVAQFTHAVSSLDKNTREFLISRFSAFRNKSSFGAKLAKQIDNIIGNQLVIEQKVGLIAPYSAKFVVDYVTKVRELSGSKTMQSLVDAQIQQVKTIREELNCDSKQVRLLLLKYIELNKLKIKIKDLLPKAVFLLKVDYLSIGEIGSNAGIKLEDYNIENFK